jgi:hypothetical protein
MKELVTPESITTICNECDIQPNHLFACFRKTLGVSQAKLAYILDTEGINQNTISRYEHKYIVTADVEYILWKWLLNEINKTWKKSKSGMSRFIALYIGGFQLYILRYANNKQAYMLQNTMIEAYRMWFNA